MIKIIIVEDNFRGVILCFKKSGNHKLYISKNIKIKEIEYEGVLGLFTRNAGNTKEGASIL